MNNNNSQNQQSSQNNTNFLNNNYNGYNNQQSQNLNAINNANQPTLNNNLQNNNIQQQSMVKNNPLSNNENNTKNSQNNLYSDNLPKKVNNKNNKLLILIIGMLLIIAAIIIVLLNVSTVEHKNTTGSDKYKDSDVDYNCTYKYNDEFIKGKVYSDLIFNYKSVGDSGKKYNYQLKQYYKMVLEYKDGLSDSKYKEFVDSFNSTECLFEDDKCTGDHLELGITKDGWDTIIDRTGNTITVTYYNIYGLGKTATKEDMKQYIESYEDSGFVCK